MSKVVAVAGRKTEKYRTNFVVVLYVNVNNEDIEVKVNQWLKDNENLFDVVDIKLSECQNKTVVLIHYRKKEENNY